MISLQELLSNASANNNIAVITGPDKLQEFTNRLVFNGCLWCGQSVPSSAGVQYYEEITSQPGVIIDSSREFYFIENFEKAVYDKRYLIDDIELYPKEVEINTEQLFALIE